MLICGVDEAGRGPLAGKVYAAAVILNDTIPIIGLKDSKKLTANKRIELFEIIKKTAIAYAITYVDEKCIDEINILNATLLAMQNAVLSLSVTPDLVQIDGNRAPKLPIKTETIIKGDTKIQAISAASILAKVSRDADMMELDKLYPMYQFAKHKGYGTEIHINAIKKYGILPIHRKTFAPIKFMINHND